MPEAHAGGQRLYLIHPRLTAFAKGTRIPVLKINTAWLSANVRASLETTMANYKLSGAHCVAIL